jgi:flagellar protein FlaG
MALDIQPGYNIGAQEQVRPPARAAGANTQSPEPVKAEAPPPVKLTLPKAPDIKYDANQIRQELSAAIGMLNQQLESTKRGLGLSYDDSKRTTVVKLTDSNTGEVVRQIPTEQVLKMAHEIDRYKGLLLNKSA